MKTEQLVRVDRDLLDRARAAFTPTRVDPSTPLTEIMYNAGALRVLEWLDGQIAAKGRTGVGTVEPTALADSHEGFMRRLSKGMT